MSDEGVQRVVVIQDGSSKEICTRAIRWASKNLNLKPPLDSVTLVAIIQPFKSATTSSFMGCGLLMGQSKLDSSRTVEKRRELFDRKIAEKLDEYHNNALIRDTLEHYARQQIQFQIKMETGKSLKEAAVQAAKNLEATTVILDRGMKKDRKYMTDNLTCGILRLKHDNNIERLKESEAINHDHHYHHHAIHIPKKEICDTPETFYKEFTYEELRVATNNFSPENLVSKGEDDCKRVYKGELPNGMEVIVKEHSFYAEMVRRDTSKSTNLKDFKSEVQALGKLRHDNIVILLGSCSQLGLRLLVYQYVCADSFLDQILSKKSEELPWEARLKVAAGAARGLQYLHRHNFYGNVRSYNIFITHDHHPLLGNFGVTRNQYEEESTSEQGSGKRAMTTFEYLAPEFEEIGKDTSKSDIYAFGVVLLQLITGRRTTQDTRGLSFMRWGRPLVEEKKYPELIDPTLIESHNLHQFYWMVHVVDKCIKWEPRRRPSIDKIVTTLSCIAQGCNIDFSSPDSQGSENNHQCLIMKEPSISDIN
ncbi:unnamed protein product [Camellia sinensis]